MSKIFLDIEPRNPIIDESLSSENAIYSPVVLPTHIFKEIVRRLSNEFKANLRNVILVANGQSGQGNFSESIEIIFGEGFTAKPQHANAIITYLAENGMSALVNSIENPVDDFDHSFTW